MKPEILKSLDGKESDGPESMASTFREYRLSKKRKGKRKITPYPIKTSGFLRLGR
jgi:hypothetical protein